MTLPAIILAGGLARRMGGGDKGLLRLDNRPLLDHVIDRLTPQCAPLALNANGEPARFNAYALPVLPDPLPGHPGPLAGVLAGLDWAAGLGAEAVITAAADTPFFPRDLATRLRDAAGPKGLALAATPSGRQPTFGLWPVALRHDLRAALEGGLRKIVQWTDAHQAGLARFDDDAAFFNVNTPDDLEQAQELAR